MTTWSPSPQSAEAGRNAVHVGIDVLSVDAERQSEGRAMAAELQSSLTRLLHERPLSTQHVHTSHYDFGDFEIPPMTGRTPEARGRELAQQIHERLHSWHG